MAAILHEPGMDADLHPSYGHGHYRAYQRLADGKWRLTNDDADGEKKASLPHGMCGIRLLILKRIFE